MGVLGCPNCTNGWVLFLKPANKARDSEDGNLVYEETDTTMLEYGEPCPYCNGGEAYVENLKQKADLPETYYDVDMDRFDWTIYGVDMSQPKALAEKFILNHKEFQQAGFGLYIWSRTRGSGKTYLASAICNSMMKTLRRKTRFVNVSQLIDISKEQDGLQQLIDAEVLVLDDLGQKGTGAEWMGDLLYNIFEGRGNRKRLTIVTSNISPQELQIDDRIADRMNGQMIELKLPEVRVRSMKATETKEKLLMDMKIIPDSRPKQTEMEETNADQRNPEPD